MTDAYQCDRCGEFHTGGHAGDVREFGDPDDYAYATEYHLCPDCLGYIISDVENHDKPDLSENGGGA